jgi:hypothetical protein
MARWQVRIALIGVFLLGAACSAVGLLVLQRGTSGLAHAQSVTGCTNASLSGTYGANPVGYSLTAADGSPLAAPLPRASANLITVDGAGNFSRVGVTNVGGTVNLNNAAAGTYTVNPDCTFTYSPDRNAGLAGTFHFFGVLVDGGKRAFAIETDPGVVLSVIWERQ